MTSDPHDYPSKRLIKASNRRQRQRNNKRNNLTNNATNVSENGSNQILDETINSESMSPELLRLAYKSNFIKQTCWYLAELMKLEGHLDGISEQTFDLAVSLQKRLENYLYSQSTSTEASQQNCVPDQHTFSSEPTELPPNLDSEVSPDLSRRPISQLANSTMDTVQNNQLEPHTLQNEMLGFQDDDSASSFHRKWFEIVADVSTHPDAHIRNVKWSPCGYRLATQWSDGKIKIWTTEQFPLLEDSGPIEHVNPTNPSIPSISYRSEDIFDMKWYPYSNWQWEGSSMILSTSKHSPIHLWDAATGLIRASYISLVDGENIISPGRVCFTTDATKIIGGFKGFARVFDIARPGSDSQLIPLSTKHRKKISKGINIVEEYEARGMVSSLATCPVHPNLFAVSTWQDNVSFFSIEDGIPIDGLHWKFGGPTQVEFTSDGKQLWVGSRTGEFTGWDLRNLSQPSLIFSVDNIGKHSIKFDLDNTNHHIAIGSSNGTLKMWNTCTGQSVSHSAPTVSGIINCASLHPLAPAIAFGIKDGLYSSLLEDENSSDSESESSESSPPSRSKVIVCC